MDWYNFPLFYEFTSSYLIILQLQVFDHLALSLHSCEFLFDCKVDVDPKAILGCQKEMTIEAFWRKDGMHRAYLVEMYFFLIFVIVLFVHTCSKLFLNLIEYLFLSYFGYFPKLVTKGAEVINFNRLIIQKVNNLPIFSVILWNIWNIFRNSGFLFIFCIANHLLSQVGREYVHYVSLFVDLDVGDAFSTGEVIEEVWNEWLSCINNHTGIANVLGQYLFVCTDKWVGKSVDA